ncbi:MAG: S8 family serine peptidase, partial [Clostridiaceae bacterium]|nr:S8 family serine peptidase [Clostridiaceae bacterium]
MRKRLKRSAATLLVLIMIFTQMLTVFAVSDAGPGSASDTYETEIRRSIRESSHQDMEPGEDSKPTTQRSNSTKREMTIENKQAPGQGPDLKNGTESGIVPNQIIVKYKPGISSMAKIALNSKVSAVSEKSVNKLGITQLELPKGTDVNSAVDKLKDDPNVEYAEPVYTRKSLGMANYESSSVVESVYCSEPFYTNGLQWGLKAINLEEMWKTVPEADRADVTIAIIDTGVDIGHEELEDCIVQGYDFVNNDDDADDDNGHGTLVAGIAAAAHDGKGIAGVAGGAKIMPVKVLDEKGRGNTVTVINGILYAVNNGADTINLSLGSDRPSRAEEEAV